MQPLCNELGVTINDLLNGEKIDKKDYQEKLAENVLNSKKYSKGKIIKAVMFYLEMFFSGIFVVPILGIIAPTFLIFGMIAPFSGLIKLIGSIFHLSVPFVIFQIGNFELSPVISFTFSVGIGVILYFAGKGAWSLLLKYIKYVKRRRIDLEEINYF